ncbi:uncharacterized protein SCHCODRAFT_02507411 [Schizophyllum commune H4-8]|uniref:Expressed protein n=1 Tax=Schizophyllum commune (strain H4-8 / FGSC 9210) TaxID=578458 RepID=D8QAE3_SCHCM|nr:uncharacterized protein SCHCODRAFT_02507411 [Schizophyllum commune H4-8]KAI5890036.1 hypothetical protein SCHCODRAFT_02507411 [Schizophyllum commune H4-8]
MNHTPHSVDPTPSSPLSLSQTAPSPPMVLDAPSQNSSLTEISDQLAYLTLQSAETAEEAKYTGTPLNRALFALRLAHRIAEETSPAARRHREWRQIRVRRFAQEMPSYLPSEDADEIFCNNEDYCKELERVQDRLAGLIGMHLSETGLCELNVGMGDITGDLKICLMNVQHRDWTRCRLHGMGWIAKNIEETNLLVSIPQLDSDEKIPAYDFKLSLRW